MFERDGLNYLWNLDCCCWLIVFRKALMHRDLALGNRIEVSMQSIPLKKLKIHNLRCL